MIAQLRSELRKMATTRTNLGLLLGLVALILFGVIAGSFGTESDLSLPENQRELIGNGGVRRGLRSHDRRHGDDERVPARHDPCDVRLHARPHARRHRQGAREHDRRHLLRRARRGLALGSGVAMIRARGYDVLIDSGDVRSLVLGTIAMSALWAAVGVGIGALVRNQVFAIVGLFAWVFVVEILLFQYLPGRCPLRARRGGHRDDR